jgi:hypothetical protein
MVDIIVGYIILTTIPHLILMFESDFKVGLQWINPIVIYDNVPVNWFGCIVLTILAHIVAGPWAVFYWFYKLCTIGRK